MTECEIFLSLIVKFLDPDKPAWQRSLALELIHRMVVQPRLLRLVEVAIFIDTWHYSLSIGWWFSLDFSG